MTFLGIQNSWETVIHELRMMITGRFAISFIYLKIIDVMVD